MNRRSFIKYMIGSALTFFGLSGGTYIYARNIEPALLDISSQNLTAKNIPRNFNGFKIIQFSDTHIGFHYTLNQLEKLVQKINDLKPDLIVFTGDLVDEPQSFEYVSELINIMRRLQADFGKIWVYGNHDHGGYGTEKIEDIMKRSDFMLLKNNHTPIEINNERIIIAGIDDAILGAPDIKTTLKNINLELYTILLAHEPDYADIAADYNIDVQFSGHSHGGQVRLPFIGHLYTPALAEKFIQGKHIIHSDFDLYVNRGIGTTRLPFRFLCKPELSVYTLRHEQ